MKISIEFIMKLIIYIVAILLFASHCFCVDRSKFKTCTQSGFCVRQRETKVASSAHYIDTSSALPTESSFVTDLIDPNSKYGPLSLEVIAYADNIYRLKITEKNAIRKRYEVKDVLLDLVKQRGQIDTKSSETSLRFDNGVVIQLQHNPLKVQIFRDNELVISGNARGLLHFEQYRKKEDSSGDNSTAHEELYEAWEEHFSTHRDSKPYGPSSVGMDFTFHNTEHVYGIPEHASDLALKETNGNNIDSDPYRLYNADVFEYELGNPMALYGSVPYLISHDKQKTQGMFWMNSAETWIDISKPALTSVFSVLSAAVTRLQSTPQVETHWFSESGVIDVFFILGPKPYDVFRQYSLLTGSIPLPPLFSIAYHQCRWNYKDETDVQKVDTGFDEHDIPYDVLWLDIEHTDSKKYFTWDKNHFPTPEKMQRDIALKHRKMVTIVDPHIKRDSNYYIHNEASSMGLYVKNHENREYEGWCWPGSSSWLDFTSADVRAWWADQFSYASYKGSTEILFTWNDMNEPSVFNGPEVTMHKDAIHADNVEHREIHNQYGFYMHMATYEGLLKRNPKHNERPFLLTRSFFAGSQRYGAVWTGDNAAQWSHLAYAQPMLLSLGLAGITFSGADVGGFFGNPDGELSTRWYQAAAFHPFFRGHAHLDAKRREPWLFGEPYTTYVRNAIRTRYTLLPYWYTTFHNSSKTGIPIMRPLWVEFPAEASTFSVQDEFLAGPHLLVKPVTSAQQWTTQVYLPGAQQLWYEFEGTNSYNGDQILTVATPIDKIPVFIRAGSIIPKKERARRSSDLMTNDPFTLIIAPDQQGKAYGDLYLDDGHSFDFTAGSFTERKFTFAEKVLHSTGSSAYPVAANIERIVIYAQAQGPTSVKLQSKQQKKDLTFEYDKQNKILIVRKPDVLITENFTLHLQ